MITVRAARTGSDRDVLLVFRERWKRSVGPLQSAIACKGFLDPVSLGRRSAGQVEWHQPVRGEAKIRSGRDGGTWIQRSYKQGVVADGFGGKIGVSVAGQQDEAIIAGRRRANDVRS